MRIALLVFVIFLGAANAQPVIKQQVVLEGNNIRSYIWNTGVFNQDLRTNNTPGLEWPKNSGKFACFTAGLTISSFVNGDLRMAVASYSGEYSPGYSENGVYYTDGRFKPYRVKKSDNYVNSPDWLNWGLMVPFGAPFTDMNNNGSYEYFIDIPGVKGASETVFVYITDGNTYGHTPSEGFGGGTQPLFANVAFTAWCYDTLIYKDVQFFKWNITNGGLNRWDSTLAGLVCDPDLGFGEDDYIGCDTSRNLGYVYNGNPEDGSGSGNSYGANPPAWGIKFLSCNGSNAVMDIYSHFSSSGSPGPVCERDPGSSEQANFFLRGFKKDGTPWVDITNNEITKKIFSGDPEINSGWTMQSGRIENCGGALNGIHTIPVPVGDKRFTMSYKPLMQAILPGSGMVVMAAQMVARGNSNKNSVTLLKQLADSVKGLCQNNFVIGIQPVSNIVPNTYSLEQNYPNPFNPVTKIKFALPEAGDVVLKIYDALGREVSALVNENLKAGEYSIDWNASNYPSGVYFYSLQTTNFTQTRKMILIK